MNHHTATAQAKPTCGLDYASVVLIRLPWEVVLRRLLQFLKSFLLLLLLVFVSAIGLSEVH